MLGYKSVEQQIKEKMNNKRSLIFKITKESM